MIKTIKINQKHGFLKAGFEWGNDAIPIPKLSVITGVNGSGKTKLLEAINGKITNLNGFQVVTLDNNTIKPNQIVFIPWYHKPSILTNQVGIANLQQYEENIFNQIKNYCTQWVQNKQTHLNNQSIPTNIADIIEEIRTNTSKEIYNLSDTDIKRALSKMPIEKFEQGLNNLKIAEIFIRYADTQKTTWSDVGKEDLPLCDRTNKVMQEMSKIFGSNKAPWELIDEIFTKYDFKHTINTPDDAGLYNVKFIDKNKELLDFANLSSGEQVIVQLILWAYDQSNGSTGKNTRILLLDEFDAHLNPKMSKMFIEIVNDILIGIFDIQVIMTTHSPSTVAYVPEESLFWMEEGEVYWMKDKKKPKNAILKELATGLILLEDNSTLIANLVMHINDNKYIIFVEGESDKIYFNNALELLGYDHYKDIFIFACSRANTVPTFMELAKQILNKEPNECKFIAILDNDEEGRNQIKGIIEKGFQYILIEIPTIHESYKNIFKKIEYPVEYLLHQNFANASGLSTLGVSIFKEIETIVGKIKGESNDIKEENRQKLKTNNDLLIFQYELKKDKDCNKSSKIDIANQIEKKKESFSNFKPTLDLVLEIINNWNK